MRSLSISVWRRAGKDAFLPGKPLRDCSFALQGVTCLITALQSRRRSPFPPANSHHGQLATASYFSSLKPLSLCPSCELKKVCLAVCPKYPCFLPKQRTLPLISANRQCRL